ncbi:MAG: Holliday junction branch migration protein RuvA [Syntrophales bacterium]
MIASLNGIIIKKSLLNCLIDVNGVGYLVFIPLSTFYELPEPGLPVVLQTHMHVREDAIGLYGFSTEVERDVFQMMISVSGIGPRLAINILSGIPAEEWFRAVAGEDLKRLTAIPGVGRKTAERMILELKDKVVKLGIDHGQSAEPAVLKAERLKEDAFSALINLGYKGALAKDVVEQIIKENDKLPSIDQVLKRALRILSA